MILVVFLTLFVCTDTCGGLVWWFGMVGLVLRSCIFIPVTVTNIFY